MTFKPNPFYESKQWRRLRKEVLLDDKYECQVHKANGEYVRANHVHHINHLDKHPELGLERYYTREWEAAYHPERLRWKKKKPLTEERW